MEKLLYKIHLDMHTLTSQCVIHVKKGDTLNKIVVNLTEHGKTYALTEADHAVFSGTKPDGTILFNDTKIVNGAIEYTLTAQTTAVCGTVDCEMRLYDADNNLLTSPRFTVIVEETVYSYVEVASTSEANAFNDLIVEGERRMAEIEEEYAGIKADNDSTMGGYAQTMAGYEDRISTLEETGNDHANAIKGQASGGIATMANVSPVSHGVKVGLRSKNLLPYPYVTTTKTVNGVTFTDNGDGTVAVNGTATADTTFKLSNFTVQANTAYYLSGCPSGGSSSTYYLHLRGFGYDVGNGVEILNNVVFTNNAEVVIKSGVTVSNLIFKPQIELGNEATAYTPYVAPTDSVAVHSCGKNLLPYPYHTSSMTTAYGITFTVNGDGSVTLNGTATSAGDFWLSKSLPVQVGQTYTYRLNASDYTSVIGVVQNRSSAGSWVKNVANDEGRGATFTVTADMVADGGVLWANAYVLFKSGYTFDNMTIKPMIEVGTMSSEYTPYVGGSITTTLGAEDIRIPSISPDMNIYSDTEGIIVDAEYNVDTAKEVGNLAERVKALEECAVPAFEPVTYDTKACLALVKNGEIEIKIPTGARFCLIQAHAKKVGICDVKIGVSTIANFDVKIIQAGYETGFALAFPLCEVSSGQFIAGGANVTGAADDTYISYTVNPHSNVGIYHNSILRITEMDFGADMYGSISVTFY